MLSKFSYSPMALRCIIILCQLFCFDTVIYAQPLHHHAKWTATAYLNGMLAKGNVERVLLEIGTKLSYRHSNIWSLSTSPFFSYGEQNKVVAEREYLTDLHFSLYPDNQFYGIAFGTAEASNLRKIEHRLFGGIGAGWQIIDTERTLLSFTNAIVYEKTDFRERADILLWRNSTRMLFNTQLLQDALNFRLTAFFQPALSESNIRTNAQASLAIAISKSLKITLNSRYSYEQVVQSGRKQQDLNTSIGIQWTASTTTK